MRSVSADERLRKELGLFDVYAISTGAMFSSGFFLLPGLAAAQTGPSVPLAYLVAALFILPAMLCVSELATAMPRAGGAYYFLDRSLGPWVGTVGGLGTWLALVLKSAFALVGMGAYLAIFFAVPIKPLAVALTVVFMAVNIVGAKETSGLQRLLVATLLGIMFLFLVAGVAQLGQDRAFGSLGTRFTPFMPFGFGGFMATVGFVFVSYAGLTKVASVSEEVLNPERNIPLGMMLSLATAALVYGLGVFLMVAILPPDQLRQDLTPVASAAAQIDWLSGTLGMTLIVAAALAAFASTGNAGVLSASRYPLAMARDGLVPAPFATLGRFRTPTRAIMATAVLMMAAIVLLPIEDIAKLASAFQLLLFSLLSLAVVIMRESRIEGYDPGYRSPFYPWMQIAGFVAPLWLIAQMGQMSVLFTLGLVGGTTAWYLHYAARRVDRSGAIFHTFARLGERREPTLEAELRFIVKEKGLREGDRYRAIAAHAEVLDIIDPIGFDELVASASARLAEAHSLPEGLLAEGFRREMAAGFLPIGRGVALPHMRLPELETPALLAARCREGILVDEAVAPDLRDDVSKVRAVLFLVSPEGGHGLHLRLLGHLATIAEDDEFLERWRRAREASELRAALLGGERVLTIRVAAAEPTGTWAGKALRDIRLPKDTLVALIHRNGRTVVPRGDTIIETDDTVTVIGEPSALKRVEGMFAPSDGARSEVPVPSS